jgi:hypothetical protein
MIYKIFTWGDASDYGSFIYILGCTNIKTIKKFTRLVKEIADYPAMCFIRDGKKVFQEYGNLSLPQVLDVVDELSKVNWFKSKEQAIEWHLSTLELIHEMTKPNTMYMLGTLNCGDMRIKTLTMLHKTAVEHARKKLKL